MNWLEFVVWKTHAIFSDGDRQGTSSSSSSSLSSPSSQSSLPDALNDDDVNISGTGKIDGRRLPEMVELYFLPVKIIDKFTIQ